MKTLKEEYDEMRERTVMLLQGEFHPQNTLAEQYHDLQDLMKSLWVCIFTPKSAMDQSRFEEAKWLYSLLNGEMTESW